MMLALVLGFTGCAGDGTPPEARPPTRPVDWSGSDGFGAAVALEGASMFAAAPHGSRGSVQELLSRDETTLALEADGRLGVALAVVDGAPLASAPFAEEGALVGPDGIVATGPRIGTVLTNDEDGWIGATLDGWVTPSTREDTPARPTSLARIEGAVGVGMAFGSPSLLLGEVELDGEPGDELGWSLVAADLDGDGVREWLAGAPGANEVRVLSRDGEELARWSGSGRFGAALAVADLGGDGIEEVAVGAPHAGDALQGRVELRGGMDGDLLWSEDGLEEAAMMGFALAGSDEGVLIGAPGGATTPGRVSWRPVNQP